ncbi:MAG: hypothetical protein A2017_16840 [Lentisphaerae bacterium GWF2_44_16]|nr:MAG: hypothetical protein A2017_16840 [Lentisphaerae bacterium GWF2_44_16]
MTNYSCPHCEAEFDAVVSKEEILFCPHCNEAVALPDEEELSAGSKLGGFEILSLVGKGGMGCVYLAKQISMHREVALKVLPKIFTQDKTAVDQFLNEVKTSGRMEHPNIVTAIDAGEADGVYFLAMTYVKGEDLESRINRIGPLPEKTALKYTLQIADALNYAWEKHKLLHRDIKPGNVMVNEDGGAYLLDMGIALNIGDASKNQDHVEGSPFYMSPEQSRGEPLDWRSDLYSLGASLYHLIVGKPPYDAPDIMRIVEMHTDSPFPEPKSRNPDIEVSKRTTALLQKMMAKTPDERFSSWKNFQKEVNNLLKTETKGQKSITSKLKKSPQLPSGGYSGVKFDYKKKSSFMSFLSIGLFIISLSAGAFFFIKFLNNKQAEDALKRAELFIENPECDYSRALDLFSEAKLRSDKILVEEETRRKTNAGYEKCKQIQEKKIKEKEILNTALKKAAETYGEANNLYKEGVTLYNAKKPDHSKYEKALKKCKEASAILSPVSSDSPNIQGQIIAFADRISKLEKSIEFRRTEEKRKEEERKRAEAARNAAAVAAETAKSNAVSMEENKKKEEQQKELQQQQEDLSVLRKSLELKKDRIRTNFVVYGRERKFSGLKRLIAPEDAPGKAYLKGDTDAFNGWISDVVAKINAIEKIWDSISNSSKHFAGTKIKIEDQDAEILKIEKSEIFFKAPVSIKIDGKKAIVSKTAFENVETRFIFPILKKALDEAGKDKLLIDILTSSGEFAAANKLASNEDQKKEISETAYSYIKFCIRKEYSEYKIDRKASAKRLEEIKEKYESLPEYSKALEDAKAENKK